MKNKLFGVRTRSSYYKIFHGKFISDKNEKIQVFINKSVYLGLSILELSKTVMYEFWNDYIKPKFGEKQNYVILIQTVLFYT